MCVEHQTRLQALLSSDGVKRTQGLLVGGLLNESDDCERCRAAQRGSGFHPAPEQIEYLDHQTATWFLHAYLNHERSFASFCFRHLGLFANLGRDLVPRGPDGGEWRREEDIRRRFSGKDAGKPPLAGEDWRMNEELRRQVDEIVNQADECAACLTKFWINEFSDASSRLPPAPLEASLREMAKLRATFPVTPAERTPRTECPSIEDYVLTFGRRFPLSRLTPGETTLVESIHAELRRRGTFTQDRHPHDISDYRFPVAQLAWQVGHGAIRYAEGFMGKERDDPEIVLMEDYLGSDYKYLETAWNLVNGKVVDFLSTTFSTPMPGTPGAVYMGVVADDQLAAGLKRSGGGAGILKRHRVLYGSPVLIPSTRAGSWEG